ncbi:MAG: DUF1987 domain-containing protein [Bacteroidetes bacterium]|nr:DUF1987 domain-containing protein [Bacteroidota bacterium]
MENSIKIKATDDTPEVIFDRSTNEFRLSGRSLPEDAFAFYSPIIKWLNDYSKSPNENSILKVSLDYFNSSSVKQILELISAFEEIIRAGKSAKVIWCYASDDDLMEIKGLEFQSMTNIPFEFQIL